MANTKKFTSPMSQGIRLERSELESIWKVQRLLEDRGQRTSVNDIIRDAIRIYTATVLVAEGRKE